MADELWPDLDDKARLRKWNEFGEEFYGSLDASFATDRPFSARLEVARFGPVLVDKLQSTLTRLARTARNVAADGKDGFFLGLNCGSWSITHRQLGRDVEHAPGAAVLLSESEPGEVRSNPDSQFLSVYVPRQRLMELVNGAEDLVACKVDLAQPVVRHLHRYLDFLVTTENWGGDPVVSEHVATTLIDLVALCLKTGRDQTELIRMRGLRAARLETILVEIRSRFSDPAFSPRTIGAKLGLSSRYVQNLLHETGASFTERVMELRLQRARALLENSRYHAVQVSEIAYACGFNDISHFNRTFRHRFGMTPRGLRTVRSDRN